MPLKVSMKQKAHIAQLVRANCCNYSDGDCLLLDDGHSMPCPQLSADSLLCTWFRSCVLPLDKKTAGGSNRNAALKRCCICGELFHPGSNRAKYCAQCGQSEQKKLEAARLRSLRRAEQS